MLQWFLIQTKATNKHQDSSETATLALKNFFPEHLSWVLNLSQIGWYVIKLICKPENLGMSAKKLDDLVLTDAQKHTIHG